VIELERPDALLCPPWAATTALKKTWRWPLAEDCTLRSPIRCRADRAPNLQAIQKAEETAPVQGGDGAQSGVAVWSSGIRPPRWRKPRRWAKRSATYPASSRRPSTLHPRRLRGGIAYRPRRIPRLLQERLRGQPGQPDPESSARSIGCEGVRAGVCVILADNGGDPSAASRISIVGYTRADSITVAPARPSPTANTQRLRDRSIAINPRDPR